MKENCDIDTYVQYIESRTIIHIAKPNIQNQAVAMVLQQFYRTATTD